MGEVFALLIVFGILIIGAITGASLREHQIEFLLDAEFEEVQVMKADCEASLPRDKFCKLEIKAVEDK